MVKSTIMIHNFEEVCGEREAACKVLHVSSYEAELPRCQLMRDEHGRRAPHYDPMTSKLQVPYHEFEHMPLPFMFDL